MKKNQSYLSRKDYRLMERLMLMKQFQTHEFLSKFIEKYYSQYIIDPDYIIAGGNIPVALVAHMDTVWETDMNHEVFYDMTKNVMVNLNGGGYDDKVGIFLIMKIVQSGLRPHIIFTTNEECGCKGAMSLAMDYPKYPIGDLSYIIQLDRRHSDDCVFYDCDNEDFEKYIEGFGFKTAIGSFTDICELCPAWGIAGVNLSVGYENEHTASEKLYVDAMFSTLDRVKYILHQEEFPKFEYVPSMYSYGYYGWGYYGWDYDDYYDDPNLIDWGYEDDPNANYVCSHCGKVVKEKDVYPVLMLDGSKQYFCSDCASNGNVIEVSWCDRCYRCFQVDPKHPDNPLCPECTDQLKQYGQANYNKTQKAKKGVH